MNRLVRNVTARSSIQVRSGHGLENTVPYRCELQRTLMKCEPNPDVYRCEADTALCRCALAGGVCPRTPTARTTATTSASTTRCRSIGRRVSVAPSSAAAAPVRRPRPPTRTPPPPPSAPATCPRHASRRRWRPSPGSRPPPRLTSRRPTRRRPIVSAVAVKSRTGQLGE